MSAVIFKPRDRRDILKIFNNIYVKNIPTSMTEESVRSLFSKYGNIKSIVLMKNPIGQFGFICFEDPKGISKEYGPSCAKKAIEELNETTLEGGNKLYVRHALKKAEREHEKQQQLIRYKNSKKRCNLYVKNFPNSWSEDHIAQLFGKYGEIESIRIDKSANGHKFAFVCFKDPAEAAEAKQQLVGSVFDNKTLIINNYQIKEHRQVLIEEAIDKADFEKYRALESGDSQPISWKDLEAQPKLVAIISQLLNALRVSDENSRRRQQRRGPTRH